MKKILYIIITILLFQFKPVLSGENYFYVLGSKPIDNGFDYSWEAEPTSKAPQIFTEEALTIGFGRDINKSLFNYDLAFELDHTDEFMTDDREIHNRVPCDVVAQPKCFLQYKDLFNLKLLASKTIGNFKPQLILGISTANIKGVVDFVPAGGNGQIINQKRLAPLVGLGLEYELSNGMSLKSEFTSRNFDSVRGGNNGTKVKTTDLRLNLFSIGLKKKF
jgi:opacity protein-like surface antigen